MKPRLCFVGPMIGRNPGSVTTQGEVLSDLLSAEQYAVISVSSAPNRYLRLIQIAYTLLRQNRNFDVAVLQVFSGPSFVVADIASWLVKALRRPLIMVLRGGNLPAFASRYPAWIRRVLGRADHVVAPSEYLARAFRAIGCESEVIPNIIDISAYPFRRRTRLRPRLLWMRSFHPIYNPEMAIRVLERVRQSYPDAELVMAGADAGGEESARRFAHRLGLEEAVRFPGFLDMAGKVRELSAASVYLNTNRVDNMPVSVIEACAMGVPVVATRVGGIPDLLDHEENGLLVPDDDADAMAGAAIRLLSDDLLASCLSEGGRRLAESCSVEVVMPRWRSLLHTVAQSS